MSEFNILFIDTAHPSLFEMLVQAGFHCHFDENINKEAAIQDLSKYHGIVIRSKFKIDREIIEAGQNLRFIARVGAGMENIDVKFAESKGIKCLHAPEGNCNAVGEHALGMLLALFNNLCKADSEVRKGIWKREENRGHELSGKKVAIIGYGHTGSSFAKILAGFDVELLVYDLYKTGFAHGKIKEVEMSHIFEQADVVSIHLPLTDLTNMLVNKDWINRFAKPFFFINTARGKIVNTSDLVKGMQSNKILGAALDVLEYESVSFEKIGEMPPAFQYLVESDKVVLSPHIAGWTHESNIKMAEVLYQKIVNLF